jgi:hypothetical protein
MTKLVVSLMLSETGGTCAYTTYDSCVTAVVLVRATGSRFGAAPLLGLVSMEEAQNTALLLLVLVMLGSFLLVLLKVLLVLLLELVDIFVVLLLKFMLTLRRLLLKPLLLLRIELRLCVLAIGVSSSSTSCSTSTTCKSSIASKMRLAGVCVVRVLLTLSQRPSWLGQRRRARLSRCSRGRGKLVLVTVMC